MIHYVDHSIYVSVRDWEVFHRIGEIVGVDGSGRGDVKAWCSFIDAMLFLIN